MVMSNTYRPVSGPSVLPEHEILISYLGSLFKSTRYLSIRHHHHCNAVPDKIDNMAEELPAKYKAVIYDQPGKMSTKVVELDMPEPAAGDVLIRL